jgi:nickel-dependent lactate racemase
LPVGARFDGWAGELTVMLYEYLKDRAHVEVLPALGTHKPMTSSEIGVMFPGIPESIFRVHDWRNALVHLGDVPSDFVRETTEGRLSYSIRCEVARLLVDGKWDRIVSIGQLVPHEVAGIANQNKNIFVGVAGPDTINKTHFVGAACNMERVMGRIDSPVRAIFNYMETHFAQDLPIDYVLTVRARNAEGRLVTRGLFAGDDAECYRRGAKLCQQVNLDLMDEPIKKAVVYLDPSEFKSTWLGNKAIYRTRMAMADEGELVIIGPGVQVFGEDERIDRLIRKYGYRGTPHTLRMLEENPELAENLSAAAHLIHGSSEDRFRIVYAAGGLTREAVESVGFDYTNCYNAMDYYHPDTLADGWNTSRDGERFFYISNPALGLWALRSQFE